MTETILVTGSTGQLGRLVIEDLIDRGIEPSSIAGLARNPEDAADLADRGVEIRQGDYDEPDTLARAFADADRLLLISSSEVGQRVEQHGNVIEAAEAADVDLFAYTSALRADRSALPIAEEHVETEAMLEASDLDYVLLRNGWYLENYTGEIDEALETGEVVGAAGDGRISAAPREDYAAAAATVLAEDGHAGEVYELGGDEAFTLSELAREISRQSGTEVEYRDLDEEAYGQVLKDDGMPDPVAEMLATTDREIANGELYTDSGDLSSLIGRPTKTLAEAVEAELSS